jgi:putative transposase
MTGTRGSTMPRSRYNIFETEYPYYCTCTIVAWLPVFIHPWAVQIIYDSWKYLQKNAQFKLFGYVIMENHLHCIAQGPELAETLRRFKTYTARHILDGFRERGHDTMLRELRFFKAAYKTDQEFGFWQEGSHPKQIDHDEMMLQKLDYMHYNPLRRGYIIDPTHWRYSSAANYLGQPGLIEVITDWK